MKKIKVNFKIEMMGVLLALLMVYIPKTTASEQCTYCAFYGPVATGICICGGGPDGGDICRWAVHGQEGDCTHTEQC